MPARFVLSLAIGSLLVGLSPMRAADADKATTPTFVVRVKSLDGLIGDAKYLGGLAGHEEEGRQLEGIYQSQVQNNSVHGIDTKRPFGAYAIATPNATDSLVVALIPVADEKVILETLKQFNFEAKKDDDGIYSVVAQIAPVPIYFRFA